MEKLLCPSLMCADFTKLRSEVLSLDHAGIDLFHMDIMDGIYVPNLALGVEDFAAVRSLTKKPMDVHLMVKYPEKYVGLFKRLGVNLIYFHPETANISSSLISEIKNSGIKAGIAISPNIPISYVKELLTSVDNVLIMTVNPGFSGEPFLNDTLPKIEEVCSQKSNYKYSVFVDGAISPEKVKYLSEMGVDGFILGSSALFGKKESYSEIIKRLRSLS
ncbi:MAG: ribulose-phosphate 3-epimerase [Liquorilactobacillus nagelii]|jgi:ribulose-phosphate 3-epimerase|uniref:ribulose-phosphate 3-epimerase n=1 Tax=Liquorilactobacillus nagelii TaxID=82688 RepID=UPI00242C6772|nr:ribulose-phosphate 3-epimerase [Liquorilactobacillus nagelii]MCI1632774.1 ribulose-phosphate 3-epimerase [Liquorilactobacillus nagelii]MCI1922390.1 ribulose-phosphate 3-epimerase [Liquorilactobacillus nagelii]MCI1976336.1 ribulose-phosphate 3-epimerase [Liquorilactobacillus nagelii]